MKRTALALLVFSTLVSAKNAPSFRGEMLTGEKTSLDALVKKDKLLLLSFWATWCVPCLSELTTVTAKLKADPTIPVELVTVNVDRDDRSEIAPTMKQMGFSFPVVVDPNSEIFGKYQKASTLPFTVLINPAKEIEAEFNGYHESMFDKIAAAAKKLSKGK